MNFCKTCDTRIHDEESSCVNCWEIEHRLEYYLKSENGRKFVTDLLKQVTLETK